MESIKRNVNKFLKKYEMHYDSIDIKQECNTFIEEMEKGLEGTESSLAMLLTYISPENEIPVNEPVIVVDAGGTNFRVAVVCFNNNGKPSIDKFVVYHMPGTKEEITKEEFLDTIVECLMPVINLSSKIGFCFSYPTEILPNKDGRLIGFNKEVKVKGMAGEEIGANLLKALNDKGITEEKKIVLLNDTVATLLGGKAVYPDRKFESFIGFILGTGTNICYIEENEKIKKAPELAAEKGSILINVESGGYGKAPRGVIDIIFDNCTADPGDHKFEKMISGAYQGGTVLKTIRKASEEGLFSEEFVKRVNSINNLTSEEISDFCYYPYKENNVLANCLAPEGVENEDDRITLYYIIDAIIERAARLTAVNLAAVILKTGKGKNPCMPVCIAAEGSTFYKSKLFRGKLDYYVKKYLNDQMGIYCEFVKAENATLIGTAIAGLLN
ncbi:MAG: hexokinase family protein [Clostridia bacterium]